MKCSLQNVDMKCDYCHRQCSRKVFYQKFCSGRCRVANWRKKKGRSEKSPPLRKEHNGQPQSSEK